MKGGLNTPPGTSASTGAANSDRGSAPMPSRRELLVLAAVLTATVVTGAAAIAGLTRKAAPTQPSPPTVSQIISPPPATPRRVEPGD